MFNTTLLQKSYPYNNGDGHDDYFHMFVFKVRKCTRSRSHDWTDCPFAHPGEKARRRDPRRFHYSGTVCSEFRRGECSRGGSCEFSHGVFEFWLHPSRYRTEPCKDGKNCQRKICFFAHSSHELRVLPGKFPDDRISGKCCQSVNSPTSTLMGVHQFSPAVSPSPPVSPMKRRSVTGFSPICRYSDGFSSSGILSYEDGVNELMKSFESINVNSEKTSDPDFGWVNDLLM